jgi:glycosyltransferase involved in cell wall biosynthesis
VVAAKIKVFLGSYLPVRDSPYYHYLFNFSPKNIEYIESNAKEDVILKDKNLPFMDLSKTILIKLGYATFKLSKIKNNECDLVHGFNVIPKTDKPFIVEMETFHSLFIGNPEYIPARIKIKEKLLSPQCKKIIFWTENAKKNFDNLMNQNDILRFKYIVLPPGVPLNKKHKRNKKPVFGFIARNFENKGGQEALEVMKSFAISRNIESIIITNSSPAIYDNIPNEIKILPLMPREKLEEEFFSKIDVLIYPGYSDSFGFIFPEAFSYGIPVITVDGCSRKEIVHNELGGHVINQYLNYYGFPEGMPTKEERERFVFEMIMAATNILSPKVYNKMSKYNFDLVKNGIFSIDKRNKELEKIYKKITI